MRPLLTVTLMTIVISPIEVAAQNIRSQYMLPSSGKPANICQELRSFVQQPAKTNNSNTQPQSLATAVQAPKLATPAELPSKDAGLPQQKSGISGQVPSGGIGTAGPQGPTQKSAAHSGATANVAPVQQPGQSQSSPQPATPVVASMPTPEMISQVEAAADNNDLATCRASAQIMRRSGVIMPAPLLALSAMRIDLLEISNQR